MHIAVTFVLCVHGKFATDLRIILGHHSLSAQRFICYIIKIRAEISSMIHPKRCIANVPKQAVLNICVCFSVQTIQYITKNKVMETESRELAAVSRGRIR